jgi:hypothetical protein
MDFDVIILNIKQLKLTIAFRIVGLLRMSGGCVRERWTCSNIGALRKFGQIKSFDIVRLTGVLK